VRLLLDALAELAQRAIDDGRFPPGTAPTVIQDILSSSIGFVLLNSEENLTAEQIATRLRGLLRQMGYRGSDGRSH
jgi:hypothetical protein